ncbi:hypothetical protein FHL15_001740 [Xylaria flabelliformis]|uniref:DUF7918 domain-containing protein n=1 Tax=Xylaria flabelliformis TaxID=2512241 RepID=A0A553IB86_9PEZI|nr:hypothetical protein FHL15_001740 [Xylaria flabelliformis]
MAIIRGLPGLEVTIFTGGRTAKEYNVPSETGAAHKCPRVVTKYIECKDNEPFRIRLKATDEYSWGFRDHILNFGAVIDGVWAKGELCRQEYTKEEDWEREISYRVVKNPNDYMRYILQEFAFSSIIKNEQHKSDMDTIERLGTIEVKVHIAVVQDHGSFFVPGGNHPKDFIISREAVKGKTKTHGTKFTRTQPAMKPQYIKCMGLIEDDGPIAIFRFKYRSREALILEGITPEPQQPFHWLVEIPDDKDKGKRGSSGGNVSGVQSKSIYMATNPSFKLQNALSNSKKAKTKIKKEKEDDGIPSSTSFTTGHNNSTGQVEAPQLKRSVRVIKISRSRIQNAVNTHKFPESKSIGLRVKDPHRKLVRKELARKRDILKKQNRADSQARPAAASQHNTTRPVTDTKPQLKIETNSELWLKQDANSMTDRTPSFGKRDLGNTAPQDKSRDDDKDAVQDLSSGLSSYNIALPSIKGVDSAVKVKIESEQNSKSKSDKTAIAQHTGNTTVVKNESLSPRPSTVDVTQVPHYRLGASNPTARSLKSLPKTKDGHRKPTKLGKPKLRKEELERKIQKLRERKVHIKPSNNRRDGPSNVAMPTTSFAPSARTISATSLLRSILSPPPPPPSLSTNNRTSALKYTKPTISLRVSQSRLGYAAANQTGMKPAEADTFLTATETHLNKEKKIAPKAAKRKANEIADALPGRSIRRPCVPKKRKMCDDPKTT